MPLIVPETSDDTKTKEWMDKLVGKTLGEVSNETTFAKTDLPTESRVIGPGMMVTKDFKPDRLNVHVDEEGKVTHVDHQ
ncbi:hypothetical protein B7494_g2877 [Chlorociboria aeruginascens]|nr:hypothetical protein B7494_g2877 [Chlorociboria aeruginascens]